MSPQKLRHLGTKIFLGICLVTFLWINSARLNIPHTAHRVSSTPSAVLSRGGGDLILAGGGGTPSWLGWRGYPPSKDGVPPPCLGYPPSAPGRGNPLLRFEQTENITFPILWMRAVKTTLKCVICCPLPSIPQVLSRNTCSLVIKKSVNSPLQVS